MEESVKSISDIISANNCIHQNEMMAGGLTTNELHLIHNKSFVNCHSNLSSKPVVYIVTCNEINSIQSYEQVLWNNFAS